MLPEARLILAASRGDGDVQGALARVDSGRVLALAAAHQVTGLVHHRSADRLARADGAGLGVALRSMESVFWHNAARNEFLRWELARLQRGLERSRVEGLVLKGPSLALRAYPHSGARPVGDIDLCIAENDYGRVVGLLQELGYSAPDALPVSGEEALSRAHHAEQLRFTAHGMRSVELHFRLVNVGSPRPEPWLWSTARSLDLGEATIRVPGPEALLFHLLLHAAQHGFAALRLLHDVRFALEVDGDALDHRRLVELASHHRCGAVLYHGLTLAESMAGARVPSGLRTALEPGRLRRAWFERAWSLDRVRRLEARLWPERLEAPRLYLLEMDTFGRKLGYLRAVSRQNGGLRRSLRRAASALRTAMAAHGEQGPRTPLRSKPARSPTPARLPKRPRVRDDALVFSVGERTLTYLPDLDRTVILKPGARTLVELCDGAHSLGEIVGAAARATASSEREVVADVVATLRDLEAAGFLVGPSGG